MTIRQDLERLSLLNEEINEKLEDLDGLKQRSTAIGGFDYSKDRVQTSPPNDAPYTSIVAMIAEMEDEIDGLVDQFIDLRKSTETQINAILSEDESKIVIMRWADNKSWHKIANALNYSKNKVHRKYNEAMRIIETQDIDFRSQ